MPPRAPPIWREKEKNSRVSREKGKESERFFLGLFQTFFITPAGAPSRAARPTQPTTSTSPRGPTPSTTHHSAHAPHSSHARSSVSRRARVAAGHRAPEAAIAHSVAPSVAPSVWRPLAVVARVRRAQRRGGEAEAHAGLVSGFFFFEGKREREKSLRSGRRSDVEKSTRKKR